MTITSKNYTKHYFAGHERIATSEGNGHWIHSKPVEPFITDHDFYISSHAFGSFDHYPLGKEEIGRPTSNVDIHSQSHDIIQYCDSSLVLASINLQYHELLKKTMGYYTTNQDGNEEIYFYHGNHLGSASWITERHGDPIQYIHYLPYGEILANQHTTYNERFKFTGKELDEESGYYYFGARYYWSTLGIFTQSDPLAGKYPWITSYAYCANNPVKYIDPDGSVVHAALGALVSAATDYAFQVGMNMLAGDDFTTALTNNIDLKSIAISAATGAIGVGVIKGVKQVSQLYKIGKSSTRILTTVSSTTTDAVVSAGRQIVEGDIDPTQIAIDVAAGRVGNAVGKSITNKIKGSQIKTMERQIDRLERLTTPNSRQSRQMKLDNARKELEKSIDVPTQTSATIIQTSTSKTYEKLQE